METAPLKSFATWARTALIREVTARIAVVLAPASPERVEQPTIVSALEKSVNAAGGGDKGRSAVADRVAYTWFNRIIALRFMDANGYTGIGVVSPQMGVDVGQPEILAEAKRGNIDPEVVGQKARETVTALLNGTRRSDDPQGETYALLLAEYCRYWNRSMPFMFERAGDFTELLIPANLLADESVLNRATKVLTSDVCQDVEVIGWLYQFYISERKDEVFAGFKKNKKAGADEIPAATQLFTPHWIVRYLVENSLGRLWMLNRPNSRLIDQMEYYIAPVDVETDFLKIDSPEELKVIDPACGSGHMLTYAFDLLWAIYEDEGYAPSQIPGLILTNNLYGTEIDPRAGALAAFALTMKARARQRTFFNNQVEPNVCVIDPISFDLNEIDILLSSGDDRQEQISFWNQFADADTFGSLIEPNADQTSELARNLETLDDSGDLFNADVICRAERVVRQAEFLATTYAVVITNPPYMGTGNMSGSLSLWLKANYPSTRFDLMTAFMARALSLCLKGGVVGMINLPSWMFLSSYITMRSELLKRACIASMLHLGRGVFGSDFGSVAFVICRQPPVADTGGSYRRLFDTSSEVRSNSVIEARFQERNRDRYEVRQKDLESLPGTPIAYWLSPAMRTAFRVGQPMIEVAEPRQGMATAENARFLRLWFEVSGDRFGRGCTREVARTSSFKWFPYNKGGEYRKWYGNHEWVVNWQNDGAELYAERPKAVVRSPQMYFRPSVSWSKVGIGIPAFRYFPAGFLFDVAGTSIFASEERLLQIAAICNSNVVQAMLAATSPTLNVEVGTIAQLPVVEVSRTVTEAAHELIGIHRDDWNRQENSWDFSTLDLVETRELTVNGAVQAVLKFGRRLADEVRTLETEMNAEIAQAYGLEEEVNPDVPLKRVTLNANPEFRYGVGLTQTELAARFATDRVGALISYAVGCMFGRYSLDEPGLILADQGATLQDYLAKIPSPSFVPDADNVLPVVDGDWFEDDIVARFRHFLRAAFGEKHFEENLRFVTEALGVKELRDYFVKSFYKDHIQRYKKRPIYWLFSSPKGSFNALIYMHRYTPSTVSTVLNEYLREYKAKLGSSLQHHERFASGGGPPRESAAAQKEVDRLRKVLLELDEYEHDVMYPLATKQIEIDLDDGVKTNYPKFGAGLKRIIGLDVAE
ncbi:BREX-1 system adenine-specific DNA-methyltransferase PglX [Rhodococcoides fascians]|uniref:BREX-1 system adenine-specific DNA-methyltransferase PglX n=1 Tax=Rhodococcoides fascians TaxID=1828 RepID=UPI00050C3EFF|nr:BREX-1 system adenine-specific DNA-methyltransferase PglX [Rhodococcus fascians]